MKRLGIVGGIAPESTIAYYRHIVATYRERAPGAGYPPIVINSIDMTRMLGLIDRGALAEVTDYLVTEVGRLERAGATFGLFASNTPHLVFEGIRARSALPLIGIVETTVDAAVRLGRKRLGILGTRFTMRARFYPDGFARHDIIVVAPSIDEQEIVHLRYTTELIPGIYRDETRRELLGVIERFVARERLDGVILGGTELPLLIRAEVAAGVPLLDTGRLHATRAVEEMLSPAETSDVALEP